MRSSLSTPYEIWQQQFNQRIIRVLDQQIHTSATLYLGCSGGMDSMLLLHLFAQIVPKRLHVISIDHQLQSKSAVWSQMVADQCQKYNVKCSVIPVEVGSGNLEAAARHARYKTFEDFLQPNDVLILAHHEQDQAETVLLRLLQGAGAGGLSAMHTLEQRISFQSNAYLLWRPFLDCSKDTIMHMVEQLELNYVDDPMNHDTDYDRVWCRENLWPLLEERFPKMQQAIGRCAVLMQDANQILEDVLAQDIQLCVNEKKHNLDLSALTQLSNARQRQLLSVWMQADNQYRPPLAMVERLKQEVWQAKEDASSVLHYAGYYFTRFGNYLYRYTAQEWQSFQPIKHDIKINFALGDCISVASGQFLIDQVSIGLDPQLLTQELNIFARRGGEKIKLYGRDVHRPLKKIIQDSKIAPWYRHQIQILMYHNTVLGVFTSKGFWLVQNEFCQDNGWLPQQVVK